MAAKTYLCGPSRLDLPGRVKPVLPGERFEHDFHPMHENHLKLAGAITEDVPPASESDLTPSADAPVESEKE